MIGKRGQITLMVIIGIILLFAISIILYLQTNTVNRQLQAQADKSINDFLEISSIKYYVTSCLDKVSAEGLTLLTEQGGVIYKNQGGLYPNPSIEGINYMPYNFTYQIVDKNNMTINKSYIRNVSYVIGDTVPCPGSYIRPIKANFSDEETSFYPAKGVYFNDYIKRYSYPYFTQPITGCNSLGIRISQMSGYFGANKLPKLCSYDGLNVLGENSCASNEIEYSFEPLSIQRQLEYYVKNNLPKCINFSNFESISQYNISVDQNNINVSSILQKPRGLVVIAQYPFSVSLGNKAPIIRQVDFQTTLDLNIRRLYTFIYSAIKSIVKIPGYNLERDYSQTQHFLPIFNVKVEKNACEKTCSNPKNFNDEIIKFSDKTSTLKGKPLEFTFAVKQRKPALDYMHSKNQATVLFGHPIDYMYFVNATITIDPHAVDPDGDNITYNYSGWKETKDSWFNYTCCIKKNCTIDNHTICEVNYTSQPHNWTNSSLFKLTNRSAQYQTNNSDVGYHEILVSVKDEHGAQDFQIVRYLIFDLPIAKLEGRNSYDDVNDSFASVEDIYYLNGSKSKASILAGGKISSFIFKDYYEFNSLHTSKFQYITTNSSISLPVTNYNFSNITEEMFSNYSLKYLNNSQKQKLHQPFLIIAQNTSNGIIYSEPSTVDVQVSECLLHGFENGTGYPSPNTSTSTSQKYHWSLSDGTYFSAPHVCCKAPDWDVPANITGGGTYYKNTHFCLNLTGNFQTCYPLKGEYEYMKRSLVDVNITTILPLSNNSYVAAGFGSNKDYYTNFFPKDYNPNLSKITNADLFNDIFSPSFEQKCSGFRGNTCGGNFSVNWRTPIKSCNDLNKSIRQFARCQAPSVNFKACVGKNVEGDLFCKNLSRGKSFEKDWITNDTIRREIFGEDNNLIDVNRGFCAGEKLVHVKFKNKEYKGITYGGNGQYLCKGTCNGKGECDYSELNGDCECNADDDDACSGVNASDLFEGFDGNNNNIFGTPGKARFVCKGAVACSYDCKPKNSKTKEACYCQVNDGGSTTYHDLDKNFKNFFNSDYFVSSNGDFCCEKDDNSNNYDTKGHYIVRNRNHVNPKNFPYTCANGLKANNTVFGFTNPQNKFGGRFLSCNGDIIYCCGATTTDKCKVPYDKILKANISESKNSCSKFCFPDGSWHSSPHFQN